jgi:hypothetical protein
VLRGDLGERAVRAHHQPRDRRPFTLESLRCWIIRCADRIGVGRPPNAYVSLSVARISNNSLSSASASAASTGPVCTPTRQIEISDSPACVTADTRAAIPSASMRFTLVRSSAK